MINYEHNAINIIYSQLRERLRRQKRENTVWNILNLLPNSKLEIDNKFKIFHVNFKFNMPS